MGGAASARVDRGTRGRRSTAPIRARSTVDNVASRDRGFGLSRNRGRPSSRSVGNGAACSSLGRAPCRGGEALAVEGAAAGGQGRVLPMGRSGRRRDREPPALPPAPLRESACGTSRARCSWCLASAIHARTAVRPPQRAACCHASMASGDRPAVANSDAWSSHARPRSNQPGVRAAFRVGQRKRRIHAAQRLLVPPAPPVRATERCQVLGVRRAPAARIRQPLRDDHQQSAIETTSWWLCSSTSRSGSASPRRSQPK